eukprot:Partr_v1_DN28479_c1_g1_i3_m41431 putative Centrosomal protein 164kDa
MSGAGQESVVLDEEIDPQYEPTQEEILEYADFIGLDPASEPHLLWIAKEGLMAPLPADWKPWSLSFSTYYYSTRSSSYHSHVVKRMTIKCTTSTLPLVRVFGIIRATRSIGVSIRRRRPSSLFRRPAGPPLMILIVIVVGFFSPLPVCIRETGMRVGRRVRISCSS